MEEKRKPVAMDLPEMDTQKTIGPEAGGPLPQQEPSSPKFKKNPFSAIGSAVTGTIKSGKNIGKKLVPFDKREDSERRDEEPRGAQIRDKDAELEMMMNAPPINPLAVQASRSVEKYRSAAKSAPTIIDRFEVPLMLVINLLVCWLLGYYQWSWLWFLGAALSMIFVYKRRLARFSELELYALRREASKKGVESHEESAEWINYIVGRFWGVYEPVLSATVVDIVNEVLEDACPAFLNSIKLTTFTLGSEPPAILGFRTYPDTKEDIVHFEVRFAFVPRRSTEDIIYPLRRGAAHRQWSSQIVLAARFGASFVGVDVPVLVENLSVEVHARIQLKLMAAPPVVKIAQVSLMAPPKVDFVLKPLKSLDIMDLPGLHSFIHSMIESNVSSIMVNPNMITVNVDEMVSAAMIASQRPIGVCCLSVIGAKIPKTNEYVGTVDPFVSVVMNGLQVARTGEITDQQSPAWNETFWIILPNDKSEMSLQVIHGASLVNKDRLLGQSSVDLARLITSLASDPNGIHGWTKYYDPADSALPKGDLNYSISFFPTKTYIERVTTETKKKDKQDCAGDALFSAMASEAEKDREVGEDLLGPGILNIALHQAIELTPKNSTLAKAMNVYAEGIIIQSDLVQPGAKIDALSPASSSYFKTKTKKKTNAPIFEQSLRVFVKEASSYALWIQFREERDLTGPSLIGELNIPLATHLFTKDTSGDEDWFPLERNSSGRARLTYTWDPIIRLDDLDVVESMGSPVFHETRGLLHLTVLEATDMEGVSGNVHVNVFLSGEKIMKTRQVPAGDAPWVVWLDATWAFIKDMSANMVLEVYESSTMFKGDRLMGKVDMKIGDVLSTPQDYLNAWYPIVNGSSIVGKIRIELAAWPLEKGMEEQSKERTGDGAAKKVQKGSDDKLNNYKDSSNVGVLRVNLIGGDGFEDFDASSLLAELSLVQSTGSSPPHTLVSLPSKKKSPEWKEFFEWVVLDPSNSSLELVIKAKKKGSKEKVGQIVINDIVTNKEDWHVLLRDENLNELSGSPPKVHLDVQFSHIKEECEEKAGDAPDEDAFVVAVRAKKNLLSFASRDEVPGFLVLRVREAFDIKAADSSGTSDPFCELRVNGLKIGKTNVVKKTLHPEWSERFIIPVRSFRYGIFGLEMFDWNRIDSFVFLGCLSIPIHRLATGTENRKTKKVSTWTKGKAKRESNAPQSLVIFKDLSPDQVSDDMLRDGTYQLERTPSGCVSLSAAFVENAKEFARLSDECANRGAVTSTTSMVKGAAGAVVGGATTVAAMPLMGGKFLAKKLASGFQDKSKDKNGTADTRKPPPLYSLHCSIQGMILGQDTLRAYGKEDQVYLKVRQFGQLVSKTHPVRFGEVSDDGRLAISHSDYSKFDALVSEKTSDEAGSPVIFHAKVQRMSGESDICARMVIIPSDVVIPEYDSSLDIWIESVGDGDTKGPVSSGAPEHDVVGDGQSRRSQVSKTFAFEAQLVKGAMEKYKSKIYYSEKAPNIGKNSTLVHLVVEKKRANQSHANSHNQAAAVAG